MNKLPKHFEMNFAENLKSIFNFDFLQANDTEEQGPVL